MQPSTPFLRLTNMGFQKVGEWYIENTRIQFSLTNNSTSQNVLYAFVAQEQIMYIGKTVQKLRQRMNGYKNPTLSQSTNIKGNLHISKCLNDGKSVLIYALPDNGLLFYGGFHVNLAAGLEDSLVSILKPAWNRTGI